MNFLTAVSRQMTRFTALIIILASIIAFIEPATFSWVKGDTQASYSASSCSAWA